MFPLKALSNDGSCIRNRVAFIALGAFLLLKPFCAQADDHNTCAMLTSTALTGIVGTGDAPKLRQWLKMCNSSADECHAAQNFLKENHTSIGGLTCDPNTDAEPIFSAEGAKVYEKKIRKQTVEDRKDDACTFIASDVLTGFFNEPAEDWKKYLRWCNAKHDECKATREYIHEKTNKYVEYLTCDGR